MSLNVGNLIATLGMDTKDFEKGVKSADAGTANISKGLAGLKTVALAASAAIAAAFVAVGVAAIKSADSVDKGMAKIRVGTGLTGDALEDMGGVLKNVLRAVPTDAETAGSAIADLNTRLGVSGEEAGALATQFLELSRITGTDVTTNISAASRVMGDWGIETENAASTLDYLFKISQNTGAGIDQLGRQLVQYGAPMRQMGFDFETAAVMLGKFEKEGVNTELVLGSMRIALGTLAREGVTDTNEAFSILVDNIKNAGSTGEANLAAIDAFGARAGPDMAAAIREGRFEIEDLIQAVDSSSDTILDAAADSMTLGDKMQILQNRIALALLPLGDRLIDMFDQLMPYIEGGIDTLAGWIDTLSSLFGGMEMDLSGFMSILAPTIDWHNERVATMGQWWEENSELIMDALENVGKFVMWLINDIIVPIWEWAWPYIGGILDAQLAVVLDVVKVFASIFAGDWDALKESLIDLTLSLMDLLYSVFEFGFDALLGVGYTLGDALLALFTAVWNGILGGLETAINKAVDMINSVISMMNQVPGVNIPLVGKVTFERATAPTLERKTLSEMTGVEKPSEIINKALGREEPTAVSEEEEIAPTPTEAPTVPVVQPSPQQPSVAPAPTTPTPAPVPAQTQTTEATIAPTVATTPTIPNIPDPLPVLSDILGSVNKLIDEFVSWAQTAPYRLIDAGTPPVVAAITPPIDVMIQPDASAAAQISVLQQPADLGGIVAAIDRLVVAVAGWMQTVQPIQKSTIAEIVTDVVLVSPEEEEQISPTTSTDPAEEEEIAPLFGGINLNPLSDAIRAGAMEISSPSVTVFETQAPAPIIDGGDLHVRVDLDGYQAGEAIVRQWRRRTGGGMSSI